MTKQRRPRIPADVVRSVMTECGHRCAVCGEQCSLECAHIIPWRKTKTHALADLLCLCANCHQRADKEGWGEKTLRVYKERPWVLRKSDEARTEPPRSVLTIKTDLAFDVSSDQQKRLMKHAIAAFLGIPPDAVRILAVEHGSLILTVEVPNGAADRLLAAARSGDKRLLDGLAQTISVETGKQREGVTVPMNVHAVFVGVDHYQDLRIPRLRCAARDAQAMSDVFESIGASVDVLINSRATAVAIRRALANLARAVDPTDTALFYFSGHGAMASLRARQANHHNVPLILPYDAIQDDLIATAMQVEEVGRYLDMISCRNVLFLFDSCYSGTATNMRSFPVPGMRAADRGVEVLPQIAGEGTIVLAACGEYEPAYEDPTAGHGIFTEFLLQGLTGRACSDAGAVSVGSLYDYVAREVPLKTESLFNGYRQKPAKHGQERVPIEFPMMKVHAVRSLANFPYDFLPLTVVIGDRREPEYKTIGDVFVYSASPAELRWLMRLGLPSDTEIVSDKVFLEADEQYLAERYGESNLLVIGSPAANLVARAANETAFFPFAVDLQTREQWQTIMLELKALRYDRPKLTKYASDPRTNDLRRYYMNQYRRGGFIDPTYGCVKRGETMSADKDYGVVTVCRNPFAAKLSTESLCIMAAGVHLPGTMHAVGLLGKAKVEFKDRPLGGVFSVTLTESDWARRIGTGTTNWSTEPYDVGKMRESLVALKTPDKLRYVAAALTTGDVDARIDLLHHLSLKAGADSVP